MKFSIEKNVLGFFIVQKLHGRILRKIFSTEKLFFVEKKRSCK